MESARAIVQYSSGIGFANNGIATLDRLDSAGVVSIPVVRSIEDNLVSLSVSESSLGLFGSARAYAQRIPTLKNAFTAYLALSMNTPGLAADNPDLLMVRQLSRRIEPLHRRAETLIQIGLLEAFHGVGTPKVTLEAARYALWDSLKLRSDGDVIRSAYTGALLGALEKQLGLDPDNTFNLARFTSDRLGPLVYKLDTLFWIAESELLCGIKPAQTIERIKAILGNKAVGMEQEHQQLIDLEAKTANMPPKSPLEEGHWFIRIRPHPYYYPLSPNIGFRALLNEAVELARKGILPTRQIDEAKQAVLIDTVKNNKTVNEYQEIATAEVAIGDILTEDVAATMILLTPEHYYQIFQEAVARRRYRVVRALGTVLPPDYQTNLLASLSEDIRLRIKLLFSQGRAYRG